MGAGGTIRAAALETRAPARTRQSGVPKPGDSPTPPPTNAVTRLTSTSTAAAVSSELWFRGGEWAGGARQRDVELDRRPREAVARAEPGHQLVVDREVHDLVLLAHDEAEVHADPEPTEGPQDGGLGLEAGALADVAPRGRRGLQLAASSP
jgi:hypothetical protein